MKKFIVLTILTQAILLLVGCNNIEKQALSSDQASLQQVTGVDWNSAFEKNIAIENVYKTATSLPIHHTLCVPVKKFACNTAGCTSVEPKVFNLIGGTRDNSNISRCDSLGCDTYKTIFDDSSEYKNIQPIEAKGFLFKMAYNIVYKKYTEITSLLLETYITYGYCLYDFELPK
jgi:hypothetical protein